jgi:signal peptidase I
VQIAAQRTLTALWVGVIPALLATLVLRYLVPVTGDGFVGLVAKAGRHSGMYLGIALFLVFGSVTRYWRYRLPGGRYASLLPAQLAPGERDPERLSEWASHAILFEELRARVELAPQLRELREALVDGDLPRAREARRALETAGRGALSSHALRQTLGWVAAIGGAALVALAMRARVAAVYHVGSTSMLPTLEPEDSIGGNKLTYSSLVGRSPGRGDIILFRRAGIPLPAEANAPASDTLVKRVIGLPGDRITIGGAAPVINGWPIPSCPAGDYIYVVSDSPGAAARGELIVEFLDDHAYLALYGSSSPPKEYSVAWGQVFVVGDNRSNSFDSRSFGGVPVDVVDARAQWFLTTQRGGEVDFGRFLRPIEGQQTRLRLDGFDTSPLEAGIARCLANRPKDTHPPAPQPEARASLQAIP